MFKVAIDAGHFPNTAGKRSPDGTLREYQFNSAVANHLSGMIVEHENVGYNFMHEDGQDVPLAERARRANAYGAHVYISIHANAHGDGGFTTANGVEVFVLKKTLTEATKLATHAVNNIASIKGQTNRGVKEGNFQVLRDTKMTAILVEAGFMTNQMELEYLKSNDYRYAVARAIMDALVAVYGLKKKAVPAPAPTKLYKVTSQHYVTVEQAQRTVDLLKEHNLYSFIEEA